MVELVIVMVVMAVAVGMFSTTVASTARQRAINRENALVAEEVRAVLEAMRNQPFGDLVRLYNPDPDDDPGGPGSAPGERFGIEGLDPLPGAPGGLVGRVVLPVLDAAALGGVGGGVIGEEPGGGGVPVGADWQLREDVQDARLGLPRDLNGDGVVDALDHTADYIILPVRVEVEWQGLIGARRFELCTMLADFRRDDE